MPLTESRKAMKRLFKSLFPDVGNHTKLYLDKLALMGARRERGAVRPSAAGSYPTALHQLCPRPTTHPILVQLGV